MELKDFFNDTLIRLPKSYTIDFKFYIGNLMEQYYQKVNSIEFTDKETKTEVLGSLTKLITGLNETIEQYYNGHPYNAYKTLDDVINQCGLKNYWVEQNISYSRNFYRLRVHDTNYPLGKKDLFHVPFQDRGKLKTQRYSIPGFPSLYLSNSIYLAWEELYRPKLDTIQAARFWNAYQLNLIDLTNDRYWKMYKTEVVKEQISQLILWPLIMVCSIKVKSEEDNFKPEYIIPQLLLQWVRNNSNSVIGIKFSSTQIDIENTQTAGLFYNIVMPVFEIAEEGYCKSLSRFFKMTEALSWQLYQFSMGAPGISMKYDRFRSDVMNLELTKNNTFDYHFSPFATLELALQMMKLEKIRL